MVRTPRLTRAQAVRMLGTGETIPAPAAPPKYGNRVTYIDGRRFASRREALRYTTLAMQQGMGEISDLACQVRYPFVVAGVKCGHYTADFVYRRTDTGETVVEDVKGVRVRDWYRTKQLMKALYSIDVREV